MKYILIPLLLFISLLFCNNLCAQGWEEISHRNFPKKSGPHLVIGKNGILYLFYSEPKNGYYPRFQKYQDGNWITLGDTVFNGKTVWSIVIDSKGTPYIFYTVLGKKPSVIKYDGSKWILVGESAFPSINLNTTIRNGSLAIDTNDVLYASFITDQSIDRKGPAWLMKYDGEKWVPLGRSHATDTLYSTLVEIDKFGTPYLVCSNNFGAGSTTVFKMEGNDLKKVGAIFPGFISGVGSMAFDANNTPFIACVKRGEIMKYGSSEWEIIGMIDTFGTTSYNCIHIDKNNVPYVSYMDHTHGYKGKVIKYNGTYWEHIDDIPSDGMTYSLSFVIDKKGPMYVAFLDALNSHASDTDTFYVRIFRYGPPRIAAGTDTICVGFSGALYNEYLNGIWSSSDTSIARVSVTGDVTGISTGQVTISYTVSGNSSVCTLWIKNCADTVLSDEIQIYPNPSKGSFSIIIPSIKTESATIVVRNILGQKIIEITTGTNTATQINIGSIPGNYIISALTPSKEMQSKVTVW